VVELADVERTRDLGVKLGGLLRGGDFVGLVGNLGAGKTELSRAICQGAGLPMGQVSSPSYAIVATYSGGRIPLHHADLYRVGDPDELYATGYFDLLGPDAAMLVEWVDLVAEAAPPDSLRIELEITGPGSRRMSVEASGPNSERLLRDWLG